MPETYHWRLLYASGNQADEPDDTTSILVCPPGAMTIVVCTGPIEQRVPVVMEHMDHERPEGHSPWVPIFYRKRRMSPEDMGVSQTSLVVFGRGCEGPNEIAIRLFAMRGGKPVACPSWAIDLGQCQVQVLESLSGVTR